MVGRIFIEAVDATSGGLPSPAKHLYLVYEAEDGVECTIRGGPEEVSFSLGRSRSSTTSNSRTPPMTGTRRIGQIGSRRSWILPA